MKNITNTKANIANSTNSTSDAQSIYTKKNWSDPKLFKPMDKEYKSYCNLLSESQQKIFRLIYDFRYNLFIKIKAQTIATKVGCSLITVKRAISRFRLDNVILTHQYNKYDVNRFFVNPPHLFEIKLAKKKSKK